MPPALDYIGTLKPGRPDFISTMTSGEKTVMEDHFAYNRRLFEQGKILLAGAATDGSIGVIIYRVESAEEIRRIYENDPAVRAGIGHPELHPFRVGHFAGR